MNREIQVLARLSNGSLRRAVHYKDQPGWQWVYEGRNKQQLLADIIVSFPGDRLPSNNTEFAAALGFSLVQ